MSTTKHLFHLPLSYSSAAERDAAKWASRKNTNARYRTFTQQIFTAGDPGQFDEFATNAVVRNKSTTSPKDDDDAFAAKVSKIFVNFNRASVDETFEYLFFKFKKGIYIQIRDNALRVFLPFSNANFVNEYLDRLPSVAQMNALTRQACRVSGYRFRAVNSIRSRWCVNGGLVRCEYPIQENDTNVNALYDMLQEMLKSKRVHDCDFFLNKRDFPVVAGGGLFEPYEDLYGSRHEPLRSHRCVHAERGMAPVLSFSGTAWHDDIIVPNVDDWIRVRAAEGVFFPRSSSDYATRRGVPWSKKKDVAIWRGSLTGMGVDSTTNQRLRIARLARQQPHLDAGITKVKSRPRIFEGRGWKVPRNVETVPAIAWSDHEDFKYVVSLQGHVSAYRLGSLLGLGSVVLVASSKYRVWFQHALKPFVHFVPVREALSDLIERIEWLRANDDIAREIASNGVNFYRKFLCRDGILSFFAATLSRISRIAGEFPCASFRLVTEIRLRQSAIRRPATWFDADIAEGSLLKDCGDVRVIRIRDDDKGECRVLKVGTRASLLSEGEIGLRVTNKIASVTTREHRVKFVTTLEYGRVGEKFYVLRNFCPGKTLLSIMQDRSSRPRSSQMFRIVKNVWKLIRNAQLTANFVHYDLSLSNIIVGEDDVWIVDFERSRAVVDGELVGGMSRECRTFEPWHDMRQLCCVLLFHAARTKSFRHCDVQALARVVDCFFGGGTGCARNDRNARLFTSLEAKFSRLLHARGQVPDARAWPRAWISDVAAHTGVLTRLPESRSHVETFARVMDDPTKFIELMELCRHRFDSYVVGIIAKMYGVNFEEKINKKVSV